MLFAERLDNAIPTEHTVRLLEEILGHRLYAQENGLPRADQPPIHPRELTGVLLHGHLTRIRSSRMREEALSVRLDFRWLAEGRRIDHTTIGEFRRNHTAELLELFGAGRGKSRN